MCKEKPVAAVPDLNTTVRLGPPDGAIGMLTHRDRAILRAVAIGTAELVAGAEPDLYLDGLACSDQFTAHRLVPPD